MMKFRDRIKELRRVKASDLLPNPKNFRTHSKQQSQALLGLMEQVGFAGAALARELPGGELQLIDGHLRKDTVKKSDKIPVLVLDVSEEEADLILATYDPIGSMAGLDASSLESLLQGLQVESDAVGNMLADLKEKADRLQATPPAYSPELTPASGAAPVTQDQIQDTSKQLEGRFTDSGTQDNIREVCCPNCGAEFGLDLGKA